MFGFSFFKICVLAIIIAAVLYGFKWVNRIQKKRNDSLSGRTKTSKRMSEANENMTDAEEMIRCITCGSYSVATDLKYCGKKSCPYA